MWSVITVACLWLGQAYPSYFWHFNSASSPGPGITLYNAPITPSGTLVMDGTSYAQLDSSVVIGGDMTIFFRFYPTVAPFNARLIDFGNGPNGNNFALYFGNNGEGSMNVMVPSASGTLYVTSCNGQSLWKYNQWNTVALQLLMIGNGLITTPAASGVANAGCAIGYQAPANITRTQQYIGKSNWVADPAWNGQLDFIWYIPRNLNSYEIYMMNLIQSDAMANAWTFQSPSTLSPNISLIGNPDLSNGYLNLHANSSQAALISSSFVIGGGPLTFVARVRMDSYQSWSKLFDFSSSGSDSVSLAASGTTDYGTMTVGRGSQPQSMGCGGFWVLGEWITVTMRVSGSTFALFRTDDDWNQAYCVVGGGWEPNSLTRNWQYIGKSSVASDSGWDGAIQYLTYWPRSISDTEMVYLTTLAMSYNFILSSHFSTLDPTFTASGSPQFIGGKVYLDGSTQYLQLSSSNIISSPMTMVFFLYTNSASSGSVIFDFGNGPAQDNVKLYQISSSTSLVFQVTNGGTTQNVTCTAFAALNAWYQIVITHDGTTATIYRNGLSSCSGSVVSIPAISRSKQYIGKSISAGLPNFGGIIDYFFYYPTSMIYAAVWENANALDQLFTTCSVAPLVNYPHASIGTCVGMGRQGTTCTLACNSPYVGLNATTGLCMTVLGAEQATWSGQSINCVARCPTLSASPYGSMSCQGPYGTFLENSICSFTCGSGFVLVGSNTTLCTAAGGGTWALPPPTCVPVSCSTPVVQYGTANCSGTFGPTSFNATCTSSCSSGFTRTGSAVSNCQADGQWSKNFPTCNPVLCPALSLAAGSVSCQNPYGGSWTYGSICSFSCLVNYTISGAQQAICGANGVWNQSISQGNTTTQPPNCTLVQCPPQSAPYQGNMVCDSGYFHVNNSVSSTCSYSCASGYQLTSNTPQVCLSTGQWSVAPTCGDIDECLAFPCLTGATCNNLNGSYLCLPNFNTSIISVHTKNRVLQSAFGDNISFTVYLGYGVTIDFTSITYMLTSDGGVSYCSKVILAPIVGVFRSVNCTIGPGLGRGLSLSLPYSFNNVSMGFATSLSFQYPDPTIDNVSLSVAGAAPSAHGFSVDYVHGDIISFTGTGFLADSTLLSVTYAPYKSTLISTCTLILAQCNSTTITCQTQPFGTGSDMVFTVNANGATVTGTDTFTVDNVPSILAMTVNQTGGCIHSGSLVYNCPTTGNVPIIILANYLSPTLLSGFIGGLLCNYLSLVNDGAPIAVFNFTCILPPGTGYNQTVVVAATNKYSQPRNLLSYAGPTIYNISGCTQQTTLYVSNCAREGGSLLVVTGINFGADGSAVAIGGTRCISTTHDANIPHNRVRCVLPSGFSLSRQVQLFQAGGPFSQTAATLDYQQCPPGSFQQSSVTTCGSCDPGRYSSSAGAFFCLPCDPGRYAPLNGSITCSPCYPGSAQSTSGMSNCTSCEPGYYSSGDAALSCIACEPGTNASGVGSTDCSACTPGRYTSKPGMNVCTQCDGGSAAGSQQPQCQMCPAGTFSLPGASVCTSCDPGYFQPVANSTVCNVCSAGSYSPTSGRVDCLPCESGYAVNHSTATSCNMCAPGSVSKRDLTSSIGAIECTLCGPGTYMATNGQAVCIACNPGSFAQNNGSTICDQCDPGYFQPNPGSSQCQICPLGTYSSLAGRPVCNPCGSGTRSNTSAATTCQVCDAGTFSIASDTGVTDCTPCSPGSYINTVGQASCFLCSTGTAAANSGSRTCTPCSPGSLAASAGSRVCSVCNPGRYTGVAGQDTCTQCPAGTFSPDYNATVCTDCTEGYYQTLPGSSYCNGCQPGRFTSVRGRDVCSLCSAGTYAEGTNASACDPCDAGSYQPVSGSSNCELCSNGTANPSAGQSSCVNCAVGTFSNTLGLTACDACHAGSYQNSIRQTGCIFCAAGFTSSNGSSICVKCPPSLVAGAIGTADCAACPPNSVPDILQITCSCYSGYYMDSGTCHGCPVGTVCDPGTTRSTIRTADSYFLSDSKTLTYQRCLSPKSCVGGACTGHRTGLLCAQCQPGYSMSEWTKGCTACESQGHSITSMVLTILGLLIAVFLLYAYVILSALSADANGGLSKISSSARLHAHASTRPNGHDQSGGLSRFLSESSVGQHNDTIKQTTPTASNAHSGSNPNTIHAPDHSTELILLNALALQDRKHVSDNTYVMKIVVNFFQVASSLISLPVAGAIAFPTYYMTFLSYFKFFNIDFIPWQNVACLFPTNYYVKMVIMTVVPAGIILTLAAVILLITLIMDCRDLADEDRGRQRRQKLRFVFVRGSIFTAFMLYPMISSTVLAHFVCIKVGNQTLLIADFSIHCYEHLWNKWTPYAAVMTLIYPIGVPVLFCTLLYINRNDLQSPFASLGLGFLHESYIPRVWWFEVLVMVEKLTLTSLLQFLPLNLQLGGGVAVAAAFLITIVLVQPEVRLRNWLLHMLANVEIVMLLLVWHFSYQDNISSAPLAIDILVSALFIGLTVALVVLLFLDILRWSKDRLFSLIRRYRDYREQRSNRR